MHPSRESHHSEVQWVPLSTVEIRRLVRGERGGLLFPLGRTDTLLLSRPWFKVKPAAPFSHPPLPWGNNSSPLPSPWPWYWMWQVHWWTQRHSVFSWITDHSSFCWWFWSSIPLSFLLFEPLLSHCKGNQGFRNYKTVLAWIWRNRWSFLLPHLSNRRIRPQWATYLTYASSRQWKLGKKRKDKAEYSRFMPFSSLTWWSIRHTVHYWPQDSTRWPTQVAPGQQEKGSRASFLFYGSVSTHD